MTEDLRPPFRQQFDSARDPYTARNALGITSTGGSGSGFITAVTPPLQVTGTTLSIDLSAYLTTATAAATYQPLDADLTAIAALTGTNVIYYRSAANTWTAVTIGTGLSFTSGTLASTVAAGGNVSNVGTPVSGQFAQWTGATTIQGVSAAATATAIGAVTRTAIVGFGNSGTWTKNANLVGIIVEIWGGGGAGATAVTGYGGSGGGYARKWYPASALGATVAVTIGAGGTAAGNGGTTTFAAAAPITASGGAGAGTTAGIGTGGDLNLAGSSSNSGISGATVGGGGNAPFMSGGGVAGGNVTTAAPTSGGGGSSSGGAGAKGLCIVTEQYSS